MTKSKKTKFEQGAHIKRNTQGTSNELSFSILDAAADAVEDESLVEDRRGLGILSIFSFRKKKVAATPTKDNTLPLSSEALPRSTSTPPVATPVVPSAGPYKEPAVEIAKRKAKRRSYNRLVVSFVVVASLVLVGGATYLIANEVTNHSEQVSTLDNALDRVVKADETIIAIDELLAEAVTEESILKAETVLGQVESAQQDLRRAQAEAEQVNSNLRESADKEAANQAIAAIEAREEMLDVGSALVIADIAAKLAVDDMVEAWGLILQADSHAREAAALVADTTNENVERSINNNLQALETLVSARSLITEVKEMYPEMDATTLESYVQTKIIAVQEAIASDEAILVQDRQTAETHNNAYNQADREAATLAQNLPDNPAQPVLDSYEAQTDDLRDSYQQARTRAGMADAFLRDYLGTSNK